MRTNPGGARRRVWAAGVGAGIACAMSAAGGAAAATLAAGHAVPEGFESSPAAGTGPVLLPVLDAQADALGVVDLPEGTDPRILRAFRYGTAVSAGASGRQIAVLAEPGVPAIKIVHVARTIEEMIAPVAEEDAGGTVSARWARDGWGERLADAGAVVVLVRSARFVPQAALDELEAGGLAVALIGADGVALPGGPEEARGETDAAFVGVLGMVLTLAPDLDQRSLIFNAGGVAAVVEACRANGTGRAETTEGAESNADVAARGLAAQILPERRTLLMQVWPGLAGEFSLEPHADRPASWAGLSRVELLGRVTRGLRGGVLDDELLGNDADNVIAGGGGDDRIDGRGGVDTAVFSGAAGEYHIELDAGVVRVADLTADRDGTDVLVGVEVLRFADVELPTGGPGFAARASE